MARQEQRDTVICAALTLFTIGDEFHYIFQCRAFEKDRSIYINAKFTKNPNVLAMEKLFSSKDHLTLSIILQAGGPITGTL